MTLADLFEGNASGNPYALNVQLNLAPWMPPVTEVWRLKDRIPEYENATDWNEVLALLNQLHTEHEKRRAQ